MVLGRLQLVFVEVRCGVWERRELELVRPLHEICQCSVCRRLRVSARS